MDAALKDILLPVENIITLRPPGQLRLLRRHLSPPPGPAGVASVTPSAARPRLLSSQRHVWLLYHACVSRGRSFIAMRSGWRTLRYGWRASASCDVSVWSPAVDQLRGQHCSLFRSMRCPGRYGAAASVSVFLPPTAGRTSQWRRRRCARSSC